MKYTTNQWIDKLYRELINSIPLTLQEEMDEWELFNLLHIPTKYHENQRRETEEMYYAE